MLLKKPCIPKDLAQASSLPCLAKAAVALKVEFGETFLKDHACKPQNPALQEDLATFTYLADLMLHFFAKLKQWEKAPLSTFVARSHAYVEETLAHLPHEIKPLFAARAAAYVRAIQVRKHQEEETLCHTEAATSFTALVQKLEEALLALVAPPTSTPEGAQAMALALQDYAHVLNVGQKAGFINQEAAQNLQRALQHAMAQKAIAIVRDQSTNPTLFALSVASGQTGLAEVDTLPPQVRAGFLHSLFSQPNHTPKNKEQTHA